MPFFLAICEVIIFNPSNKGIFVNVEGGSFAFFVIKVTFSDKKKLDKDRF